MGHRYQEVLVAGRVSRVGSDDVVGTKRVDWYNTIYERGGVYVRQEPVGKTCPVPLPEWCGCIITTAN